MVVFSAFLKVSDNSVDAAQVMKSELAVVLWVTDWLFAIRAKIHENSIDSRLEINRLANYVINPTCRDPRVIVWRSLGNNFDQIARPGHRARATDDANVGVRRGSETKNYVGELSVFIRLVLKDATLNHLCQLLIRHQNCLDEILYSW
jgi:hypothetical protein